MLLHSKELPSPSRISERRSSWGVIRESSSKKKNWDFEDEEDEDDCAIDSEDEIIEWWSIRGYKTSGVNWF